ncbi:hypothetical protein GWK47_031657 [Chionoecetes opilio]|uniref:HAT C-terminal dimerisation domain-containing protein n=1 Tax=Chionoecetes opilio TaxID=41210 RepID=A0A8J5D476_CHIOP|nr:hypothetical protein GWK47_031657 [Chionoecetes opilio]
MNFPETIEHFLLQCPRFHSHRVVLQSQLLALNVTTFDLPTLLAAAGVHPSRQHAVIRLTCAFLRKTESCKQCELDGDVDEELEKNLHSWTQLDVQDNVPLSPEMFPMEHRQIWVDLFIRYNTPVSSSAAVERLFSMGSDVMRPKRWSLTAKNLEKLVFLKGNMNLLKGRWELEDSDEED